MDANPLPLPDVPPDEAVFLASPTAGARFANPWGVNVDKTLLDVARWRMGDNAFAAEKRGMPSPPMARDPAGIWTGLGEGARLQWLGHASVLVEVDGVTVLIDPVFGKAGPVVPRLAPPPLLPQALPRIDAVMLTHGHYDHCDAPSLRAVATRWPEALFVTPRGLEGALPREAQRRVSLGWWERTSLRGVDLCLVPAQHWHRRGPFDQNRALWGGVVIRGSRSVYHSGDTGFFGGFRTIGRVFPDLDVAVLPLGAYEPRWFMSSQHMAPEQSVQAFLDLGARLFVGMHWGTFDLTDEPYDHGAYRLLPEAAAAAGVPEDRLVVLTDGGGLGGGGDADVRGAAPRP